MNPKGFKRDQGDDLGKDGIRRKRNRRPATAPGGRKATDQEVDLRVDYCATLRALQWTDTQVCHEFKRKYGLCWRTTTQIYIVRADKLLRERASINAADARRVQINLLLDILRTGTNGERLRAERAIAEIFGTNAPRRLELSGPDGGPVQTVEADLTLSLSTEERKMLAELLVRDAAKEGA